MLGYEPDPERAHDKSGAVARAGRWCVATLAATTPAGSPKARHARQRAARVDQAAERGLWLPRRHLRSVDDRHAPGGTAEGDAFGLGEDLFASGRAYPLARIAEPDDLVPALVFLCGESGAYVTGQVIHVNGGSFMP